MKGFGLLISGVIFLAASGAIAQTTSDDILKQLAPAQTKDLVGGHTEPVLAIQDATKDEFVARLGSSSTRNLGAPTAPQPLPAFVKGHEAEVLAAIKDLPSAQVAISFQGTTDALTPEAGTLLETLSQALGDTRLASARIMIGVHTNSIGSDEYNLDLSNLRARAIVDTLAAVHGVSRSRLVPFGFGRIGASQDPTDERIQVVNLGSSAFELAPTHPAMAATPPPNPARTTPHVARLPVDRPHFRPRLSVGPALSGIHVSHRIVHRDRSVRPTAVSVIGVRPEPASSSPLSGSMDDPAAQLQRVGGSGGGGGGGSGGGGWSDRRLKRRIRRVGASPQGYALYSFQYVWGGPLFVGVIAQEIMTICPEAVIEGPGGYLRVDYDKLGMRMMTLDEWLRAPDYVL